MPDFGDPTDPTMPPAERAVRYLLERIRNDADLRYLMLGTQAFALLVAAEARRTGWTIEAVEAIYSTPVSTRDAKRPARLSVFGDLLRELEAVVACYGAGSRPQDFVRHMGELIEDAKAAVAEARRAN